MYRPLLLSLGIFLLAALTSPAQVSREILRAEPDRAATVLHPYPAAPDVDTPAPPGYKPFYISHYGRHGSRYEIARELLETAPAQMALLQEEGLLTEKGKELFAFVSRVVDDSQDRWGELTDLGAREHEEIALRMYKRFRPVFRDRTRRDIHCTATSFTRTITSMASSTGALRSCEPGLRPTFYVGKRYHVFMLNGEEFPDSLAKARRVIMKQWFKDGVDTCKAGAALFTDTEAALARIPEPLAFFESIYRCWAIHLSMGYPFFDLREYLDEDAILTFWHGTDSRTLANLCYPRRTTLVREIIRRADEAIAGGTVCADLRYGHDATLLPLLNHMGMGLWPITMEDAGRVGDCAVAIPMGSNLQLVFYRKRGKEVLVKCLYNERERAIPALEPVSGPYYRWSDVKAYWAAQTGKPVLP